MIRGGAILGAALLLGAAALGAAGGGGRRPETGVVGDLASDLRRLRPRWERRDVRSAVERWGPRWLPGVPPLALVASGVTAVSAAERGGPPDFATGLWGVELERARPWATDATTRADLGRAVDLDAAAFARDIEGQAYLGFRSYSDHLATVLAAIPESTRGSPGSVWRWRLAVAAYSSGPGPVAGLVRAAGPELAAAPEGSRWAVLSEAVLRAAARGERALGGVRLSGRWRGAFLLLRCERRARAGRALAGELAPGDVPWWGELLGSDVVDALERVAAGEPPAPPAAPPAAPGEDGAVVTREGLRWVEAAADTLGVVLGGTATAALASRGAAAVGCGPMFDSRGPEYALRDRAGGVDVPSRHPQRGLAIALTAAGTVVAGELAEMTDSAAVVVQGYPTLVRSSRPAPVAASPPVRRVALAVLSPSRVALVAGEATMQAFAEALVRGGAREALYLDGGRAAHLQRAGRAPLVAHGSERPASWILLGRV